VPFLKFKDSKIQGFKDSKIQGFKNSKIQGFKDSTIQKFKDSKIQKFNLLVLVPVFKTVFCGLLCFSVSVALEIRVPIAIGIVARRFKDSKIQEFKDSKIQKFKLLV
jgi:hypothetical protein